MNLKHEIIVINNINDRKEVLDTLSDMYTDEDLSGNNGEEFTWESAVEQGFNSSQEYIVSLLDNSGLEGVDLVEAFLHQWFDHDSYYGEWTMETAEIGDSTVAISYAVIEGD